MRDLSNRVAPYILFDGALAVREREARNIYERMMTRLTGKKYYQPSAIFARTLHTLSYRGEYNIAILFDREEEAAGEIWDAITDEQGFPEFRVLDGKPTDVDFIAYPIKHYFSGDPSRTAQTRVGEHFNEVWGVLS